MFKAKAFRNSWPNVANATPQVVELNKLTSDMVYKLVEIRGVYFVKGGKMHLQPETLLQVSR